MDADLEGAAHVGRAMLKAMRETGLPPYEQVQAAIDALIVINGIVHRDSPKMSSDFGSEDVR